MPAGSRCLVLALAAVLAAQERKPLLGRVLAADAAPVAGATVTLFGMQSFGRPRDADTVTATTDQRGRFRAMVLPFVPYCGFAAGAAADGTRSLSRLQGWFGAGALIELRCTATEPGRLRRDEFPEWREQGPLQWSVLPSRRELALGPALPFAFDDDGTALVPAVPGVPNHLGEVRTTLGEVRTATGEPLWRGALFGNPASPHTIPLRVEDGDGKPLAGAAISVRVGVTGDGLVDDLETAHGIVERRLGATDAEGRLGTTVLCTKDPFGNGITLLFTARARGCAESLSGFSGNLRYRDDRRNVGAEDEVRFTLRLVEPLVGRIVDGGTPVAGARVCLTATAKLFDGIVYTHDARNYEAVTDATGAFAFADVPEDLRDCRAVVLPPDGGPALLLPAQDERKLPAATIDLQAAGELQLQLLDCQRGPAAGQAGYLQAAEPPAAPGRAHTVRFCVDASGRCSLRVWPGEWAVFAGGPDGHAFAVVRVAAGKTPVELAFTPYARRSGRLLDEQGRPVVGANVVLRGSNSGARGEAVDRTLFSFARAGSERLWARGATQPDGSFSIPFVPMSGFAQRVWLAVGGRHSDEFVLVDDPAPLQLRLQ